MTEETSVYPFSSGSQYGDWTDSNCRSCSKAADPDHPPPVCPCDLEQAMLEAFCGDGRVSLEIAGRLGWRKGQAKYGWPCPEHQPPFINVGDGEGRP